MWEETQVPGKKPMQTWGERANSTQSLQSETDFFSLQFYNKMMLNEMTLFMDLLGNRITKRMPQSLKKIQSRFKTYFTSNPVVAIRKAWKNETRGTNNKKISVFFILTVKGLRNIIVGSNLHD